MSNRRLPNRGVRDAEEESVVVDAKVKGVAGASAGAVAGVSDHRAAQTGHAAAPETQRRWKVWAHSDVNTACQRPMMRRQASHSLAHIYSLETRSVETKTTRGRGGNAKGFLLLFRVRSWVGSCGSAAGTVVADRRAPEAFLTNSVYPPPTRPYRRGSCSSSLFSSTAVQRQSAMHAAWQSDALVTLPSTAYGMSGSGSNLLRLRRRRRTQPPARQQQAARPALRHGPQVGCRPPPQGRPWLPPGRARALPAPTGTSRPPRHGALLGNLCEEFVFFFLKFVNNLIYIFMISAILRNNL